MRIWLKRYQAGGLDELTLFDWHGRPGHGWVKKGDKVALRRTSGRRRIKLIFLPAYAPHLNAIERLWGVMHREDPQHLLRDLRPLHRGHRRFLRPEAAARVDNLVRHHHRQFSYHLTPGVSGSGVNRVYPAWMGWS